MNGITVCRTNPQVVSVLTQKKKAQNWWWLQMKGRLLTNNSNNETEEGIRSNLACFVNISHILYIYISYKLTTFGKQNCYHNPVF